MVAMVPHEVRVESFAELVYSKWSFGFEGVW